MCAVASHSCAIFGIFAQEFAPLARILQRRSADTAEPRTRFAQLRPLANAWRLAGLFWREQRGARLALGLTLLAQGVIPALYLLVLGYFVDQIGALTKPPFAVGPRSRRSPSFCS